MMKLKSPLMLMGFIFAAMMAAMPNTAQAAVLKHGIAIQKVCLGPEVDQNGFNTPYVMPGETATSYITVTNNDDFNHVITIDSITDVVHHFNGDDTSPNLLAAPYDLNTKGSSVDVSYDSTVLAGDLPFAGLGELVDTARTSGTDRGTSLTVTASVEDRCIVVECHTDADCATPENQCQKVECVNPNTQLPGEGRCVVSNKPDNAPCPDEGNKCTDDYCSAGTCTHPDTAIATNCKGDACTARACNPDTGFCEDGAVTDCSDGNLCTQDLCDPVDGCSNPPTETAANCAGDACTARACKPETGTCDVIGTTDCSDGNLCTQDLCDAITGCSNPPTAVADSCVGNVCQAKKCDTTSGLCENDGQPKNCDDNDLCTNDYCSDQVVGGCYHEDTQTASDCKTVGDSNACTTESCKPSTGLCTNDTTNTCDDSNDCTTDQCDPQSGNCSHPDNGTCVALICRTPGYWKTHAGDTKKNSTNVSQAVINLTPDKTLYVCGERIVNTDVNDAASVEEAMCISVSGNSKLQLVRQLTAAALNCAVTNGDPECNGLNGIDTIFNECNAGCASGSYSGGWNVNSCISAIDAFNNGLGQFAGCHDRDLPYSSPANSTKCDQANSTKCLVIGPTEGPPYDPTGNAACKKDSAPAPF